jgi:rSAM/selenodomain-associated transferase 1
MTGTHCTLAVIAKAPAAGRTKTRLCPPCTPQQAAELAAAALADTLRAVAATPAARHVVVLDGAPGNWLPSRVGVIPQRGEGLADRLAAAFTDLGGPTLVIGMDTPQVTPRLLAAALSALARSDAVLGPAPDGGYWAIGLHEPDPAVFAGVPMSHPRTGAEQRARLRTLGLAMRRLPVLRDVDAIDDARAVAALAPHTRFARCLARLDHDGAVAA